MLGKLRSIGIGAILAGIGAVLGYVADAASGGAFGAYSVVVSSLASVAINAVRKIAQPAG